MPKGDCYLCLFVQVMDPKKATNEKVIKDRKPDHTLISFFGDDSYGWFPKGRDIIPFEKNFAAKSKQPASKKVQHNWLCLLDTSVLEAHATCNNALLQRHICTPTACILTRSCQSSDTHSSANIASQQDNRHIGHNTFAMGLCQI